MYDDFYPTLRIVSTLPGYLKGHGYSWKVAPNDTDIFPGFTPVDTGEDGNCCLR